jgi:N-methylhydantoinase B
MPMQSHPTQLASDLVTEEVVRMAIRQIAMEVSSVLARISGSPVITEADDYTVIIFSSRGELLDSDRSPAYTGAASKAVRVFLDEFGDGGFAEGDVFLGNDPHSTGAMHANDFQSITPVFLDGECVGLCYLHAHMLDVGGIVPGGWGVGATDCYGEAFRMPFVKYVEGGRINTTVQRILSKNTRLPETLLNDVQGMVAAGLAGAKQLGALVARYGRERYEAVIAAFIDRTEAAARKRLAALPDGVFEVVDWMEHNGHVNDLYEVRAKLTVSQGTLSFTFTGVPQTNGLINATDAGVLGYVTSAVSMMLFWDLPVNEGIRRVFSVSAARGTVICSVEPAPVSASHMDGSEKAMTCTCRLIAQAMEGSSDPELQARAGAPFSACVSIAVFAGVDRSGAYKVFADMTAIGSGAGASPTADGLDAGGPQSGSKMCIPDVESYEQAYPVLYLYRRMARDSGGAGRYRGGVGLEAAWTPWGAEQLVGITNAAAWQVPVPGLAGGYPGGATEQRRVRSLRNEPIPPDFDPSVGQSIEAKAKDVTLRAGDIWYMRYPGGGGWGDPLDRDPALVVGDVRLGVVGEAAAQEAYGVVLSETASGYDPQATERRRLALRQERLAEAQHRDDGAPTRRTRLAEGLARNGAYVSPRDEVELVETFDPATGRTKDVVYLADMGEPVLPPPEHRVH